MDRSIEQDFFAGAPLLSDVPVSFDLEERSQPFDLESREQRRAHFTRVVSGIIATLGLGALLALTRSAPGVSETSPVVVAHAPIVEVVAPSVAPAEPASVSNESPPPGPVAPATVELPLSIDVAPPPAPSTKNKAARRKSAVARMPAVAPPRGFATKTPVTPPLVPADRDRPPPTARFAD